MSTDYEFRCVTCPVEKRNDGYGEYERGHSFAHDNWRTPEEVQRLVALAPQFAAIGKATDGMWLDGWDVGGSMFPGAFRFFAEHEGHDIHVFDEYGRDWSRRDEMCGCGHKHDRHYSACVECKVCAVFKGGEVRRTGDAMTELQIAGPLGMVQIYEKSALSPRCAEVYYGSSATLHCGSLSLERLGTLIAARAEDVLFMASARSNVPALVAEARRLRALMKRVEWSRQEDPHWTSCPWGCIVKTNWEAEEDANGQPTGAHGYRHEPECPAFTEDGEVK